MVYMYVPVPIQLEPLIRYQESYFLLQHMYMSPAPEEFPRETHQEYVHVTHYTESSLTWKIVLVYVLMSVQFTDNLLLPVLFFTLRLLGLRGCIRIMNYHHGHLVLGFSHVICMSGIGGMYVMGSTDSKPHNERSD